MNSSIYEEDFLRQILHQPSFPSMTDTTHSPLIETNTFTTTDVGGAAAASSLSLNDSGACQSKRNSPSPIISGLASFSDKPATSSSSTQSTYILSFDNSTLIPGNTRASLKRTPENNNNSESKANQRTRKSRSSSDSLNHIMSERKRRQELTEKFIALSATIPGLKKIDKSSVLSEAINHMKKLKERVRELEEENKKISGELLLSMSGLKKSSLLNSSSEDHHQDTISSETVSFDDCFRMNEALPEVEARVLHNQVLIRIHCEKQKCVLLNILAYLRSLHFSITSTSVLTFGNSALDITIIAEVEEHKTTVKELVKKLRSALLKKTSHNQK
ncbi:transcription factor bHLH25-like [Neltuma alba]|uniref:transcription factor bHLH25-like n=1 Tax=Neltuma alba TaxID=207710 RepID=UPI0010A3D2FA|nr:transcription factor bHLH25-like [Prosopis alba]